MNSPQSEPSEAFYNYTVREADPLGWIPFADEAGHYQKASLTKNGQRSWQGANVTSAS